MEDVNEFAPKWSIRSDEKEISEDEKHQQPVHTLTTNVAIEEGQLLEEVRTKIFAPYLPCLWPWLFGGLTELIQPFISIFAQF